MTGTHVGNNAFLCTPMDDAGIDRGTTTCRLTQRWDRPPPVLAVVVVADTSNTDIDLGTAAELQGAPATPLAPLTISEINDP